MRCHSRPGGNGLFKPLDSSLRWNDGMGKNDSEDCPDVSISLRSFQSCIAIPPKAEIQKTRARALPGDRVLRAFINAAEAMQIAVAAGLLAGRADGGAAVTVVLREAR